MSEADKLFEKLGYELFDIKICPHSFRYIKKIDKFRTKEIILEKASKRVTICYYKIDVNGNMEALDLVEYHFTMQELKAINKKCEELGWEV